VRELKWIQEPVNTSLESKLSVLQDRAQMLDKSRSFFKERDVMEVDCPSLSKAAPVATHIDVMQVDLASGHKGYLHTSAEYGMKRLLSLGVSDIYQLSHVFRDGEIGPLHNPEFTMVEWYRVGALFFAFIQETLDYIRLFLSYREVFTKYCDINYETATTGDLLDLARKNHLNIDESTDWDKDTLLQLIMSFLIEPHLGIDELTVIYHYPASQAALSQTIWQDGQYVAERFEVYYQGKELANGYHELTDAEEQRERLVKENAAREKMGKNVLPIDEDFISAIRLGIPDCCGVAVGFDRLMLLKHGKTSLEEVLPFAWGSA
jgi:lysyl-tRNA synthetase class 2